MAGHRFGTGGPLWGGVASAVAALACLIGCGRARDVEPDSKTPDAAAHADANEPAASASVASVPTSDAERGPALYSQHCSACHGEKGDGQGIAARFLYPKPRDFRAGRFRVVSTTNGVPTLDDLLTIIERGMPGSAMVPWGHLPVSDRQLLAQQVIALRQAGVRDVELALAADADEERTEEELQEAALQATTPGELYAVPPLDGATPEAIARGKQLFVEKGCASCHGPSGKGDGQQNMVDAEGFATRPRNLVLGIYKGLPDPASVFRRIWLGMPGSPMPSSQNLTTEQVADMVHFVLSLSDEAARDRAVLRRRQIVAKRVERAPVEADDPQWANLAPAAIGTTPVWWRDDPDPELAVQAAHDGKTLAVRLSWTDATRDDSAVRADQFEDMVAVQFYEGDAEPFLGMGAAAAAIDLWQWRAGIRSTGAEDWQLDEYPFDEPIYRELAKGKALPDFVTARVAGNPLATREADAGNLVARGIGSVTFRPKASQVVEATASWSDGRWTVLLRRAMSVAPEEGLSLAAGRQSAIALAVWDGRARDRAAQKRISVWNDLRIE